MMAKANDSSDGSVHEESSGSAANPRGEGAGTAAGRGDLESEIDQSQSPPSQISHPKGSGGIEETNPLVEILETIYPDDDKSSEAIMRLRDRTKEVIAEDFSASIAGKTLFLATIYGLEKPMEVMLEEIQKISKDYLHEIVNWHDKDWQGWTPLHAACFYGSSGLVRLLVGHEADKEARDEKGMTPLHTAVQGSAPEIVQFLLEQNAKILAEDHERQTPLILATRKLRTDCLRELLKVEKNREQRYKPVSHEKSAIQWAIKGNFTQGVVEMFEDPLDHPDDEDVTKAANEILKYAVCTDDDLNDQVEKVVGFLLEKNLPLPEHPKDPQNPDAFLLWAAERYDRHSIARQLLQLGSPAPPKVSAIEMAARQRKRQVLWSLIAASPRDTETINQVAAALANFKNSAGNFNEARDTTASIDIKYRNAKDPRFGDVVNILRNPPIGLRFGAHGKNDLKVSDPDKEETESMRRFDNAIVAEFWGGRDVPVQSVHNVYDVVYSEGGPSALLTDAKYFSGFSKPNHAAAAKFTWVHLPATNIKCMEDLSLRLMMDGEPKCGTRETRDVKSFLRTSWFQVPDESSETRIMRPQFKERSNHSFSRETRARDIGTQSTEEPEVSPFVASSAVYMPFLAFSTLSGTVNDADRKSDDKWPVLDNTAEQRIADIRERYRNLIEQYDESQTVHGCATLDEAYYHFSTKEGDDKVQNDRTARNRSQVVTKQFLRRSNRTVPASVTSDNMKTYWPVLRVNQIWIWTIADKWIISATSHQPDDYEQPWIDGFLQHLNQRLATGGTQPQPASTSDMMRVMIDYCIWFYERRRDWEDLEKRTDTQEDDMSRELSMRQIFSNHINYVAREETNLFERFCQEVGGNSRITDRVKMAKGVTSAAERLLSEIKDVRDELNILRSIVNYQNIVQRQVYNKLSSDSSLSSRYISNDIADMEKLATRIQSAVDTTLSLSGSHIANLQAEEAARQGKSLMMFTISTIVFLPLSFLTSFFALDNGSFQNVPVWVFIVIFSASLTFTVSLIVLALYWNSIWTSAEMILDLIRDNRGHPRNNEEIIQRMKSVDLTLEENAPNEPNRSIAQVETGVTDHQEVQGLSSNMLERYKLDLVWDGILPSRRQRYVSTGGTV